MVKRRKIKKMIRTVIIELLIYFTVVVAYFYFVLRYLRDWLGTLYANDLVMYAVISLGLIVAQAIFLEIVTSFLLSYTNFDMVET